MCRALARMLLNSISALFTGFSANTQSLSSWLLLLVNCWWAFCCSAMTIYSVSAYLAALCFYWLSLLSVWELRFPPPCLVRSAWWCCCSECGIQQKNKTFQNGAESLKRYGGIYQMTVHKNGIYGIGQGHTSTC